LAPCFSLFIQPQKEYSQPPHHLELGQAAKLRGFTERILCECKNVPEPKSPFLALSALQNASQEMAIGIQALKTKFFFATSASQMDCDNAQVFKPIAPTITPVHWPSRKLFAF
jgi:hypothetical protein